MITNAIARRYAKALVQLGAEDGAVEKYQGELSAFEAVLAANLELVAILTSPAYGIEAKRAVLKELVAKLTLSLTVGNFLNLVLERNRLQFLPQISVSYRIFADELSGVVRPKLTTALPLDDGQVAGIKGALEKATGKQVVLSVSIDPSLLGGVVAQIGDKVFDGSVKTQLTRLQDILQKG